MKTNTENTITTDDGRVVPAQEPVIVSASRSTDIPAFYCDWFIERLKKGYSVWTNPFNGKNIYVSYRNTRFIVFWSKNPQPLLKYIDVLDELGIKCYIQYTLNDYEAEKLEKNVEPLAQRIETFRSLVQRLGVGSVIWRFDPLLLTEDIDIDCLITKIANIGDQLKGYTEKLVFSFADIYQYKKVKKNLDAGGVKYHDWTTAQMTEFAEKLVNLNRERGWNYDLATCGEAGRYEGITPNHCIDYNLMVRIASDDKILMDYIGASIRTRNADIFGHLQPLPANAIELSDNRYVIRDGGQREHCGCMKSKDIGQYNTCIHMCEYCYANSNKATASENYKRHKANPHKDAINRCA